MSKTPVENSYLVMWSTLESIAYKADVLGGLILKLQ